MPKSSLNRDMIEDRLTNIRNCLIEMHKLSTIPQEEFLSDVRNWAACETFLRHALEDIFDIGRHILARIGGFELGLEYKSIAKGLSDKSVVSREMAEKLVPIAGYRNRLVHFYQEITPAELYHIIRNELPDIERFIREIETFLRASS
jgi:uncharacterized protein YutE (UPF0331/DUF86 family)